MIQVKSKPAGAAGTLLGPELWTMKQAQHCTVRMCGECLARPGTALHVGKYKEEGIYKGFTVGEANWSTSPHCTKCSVPGGEWGQLPRAL